MKRNALFATLAILAIAAVIAIIISADRGTMPGFLAQLYAFPYGDKVGHFLLMGTLGFTIALALPTRMRLPGLILLALLITGEEISQAFFSSRTFSLLDLSCSLLGVIVFGGLGMRIRAIPRRFHDKHLGG